MVRPYRVGYRFEKRFEKLAMNAGWYPFRHAGSKFPDYMLCRRDGWGRCAIVEVKKDSRGITVVVVDKVRELAAELGVEGYLAYFTYVKSKQYTGYCLKLKNVYSPDGRYRLLEDIREWVNSNGRGRVCDPEV